MGGYLLFWKDIPGKDQAWYDSWQQILSPRKLHQEIDCVFYGVETSLFTDDMIVKIQAHSNKLKSIPTNYMYTTPSGYIARATFFEKIKKNHNYLIGVDMAKGRGQDYSVIEVIDYENYNQIFEFKDNHIQHDDFVKTLNNICLIFIKHGANIIVSIESNMTGSAVINDLIAHNNMYKMLIYRNTIAPDTNKTNNNTMVPYFNCKYGVEVTTNIRDLLINYIFTYIDKNIECIHSKELINEIESLEIGKDGKIQGNPHDDTVFALGHCLLVKNRGRAQNILSIFNGCNDIRNDPTYSQQMRLSLANVSDDIIDQITGANSDELFYERVGLMESAANMNPLNNSDNINEANINALQLLSGGVNTLRMDQNGNIDRNSIDQMRRNLLTQTQILQMQHSLPTLPSIYNNNKKKRKKEKEIHYYSDDSNNMFTNDEDHALDWIANVIG